MASEFWPRLRHTLFALALPLSCASGIDAQSVAPNHAKVDLVAEGSALVAGHVAWIGILFDLERGWHIYWVNPGDAGDPPHIQWHLTPGFRAGEIRWPAPARLFTGSLTDYGYEGRVLLAVPLHVPSDYRPGTPSVLAADVRYVICREVCVPATAQITLVIPSSNRTPAAAVASRELFRTTRERWPKPLPPGWEITASDTGSQLVLSLRTGAREAKATFFPFDPDQIDNTAAQVVTPSARGAQLSLQKTDPPSESMSILKGIIVLGSDRAFEIAAPVATRR